MGVVRCHGRCGCRCCDRCRGGHADGIHDNRFVVGEDLVKDIGFGSYVFWNSWLTIGVMDEGNEGSE